VQAATLRISLLVDLYDPASLLPSTEIEFTLLFAEVNLCLEKILDANPQNLSMPFTVLQQEKITTKSHLNIRHEKKYF